MITTPGAPFNPIVSIHQRLALKGTNIAMVSLGRYNRNTATALLQLSRLDSRFGWVAATANTILKLHSPEQAKRTALLELLDSEAVHGVTRQIQVEEGWQETAQQMGEALRKSDTSGLRNAEISMQTVVKGITAWDPLAVQASLAGVVKAGGLGELQLAIERIYGGISRRAYTRARRALYNMQDEFARQFAGLTRLSPEAKKHHLDSIITAGRGEESEDTAMELIGSAPLQRMARLITKVFRKDLEAGSLTHLILGRKEKGKKRSGSAVRNNRNVINILAAALGHRAGIRFKAMLLAGEDLPGRNCLYDEESKFTFDAATFPVSLSTVDMWQSLGVFGEGQRPAPAAALIIPSLIEFASNALRRGNKGTANNMIAGAMKVYSDIPALHVLAARIGNKEEAERHLKRALAINPRSYIAREKLHTLYKHQGRWEEAMAMGQAADRTATQNIAAIQSHAANWGVPPSRARLRHLREELALLFDKQGDQKRAEEYYQATRALDPNDMVTEVELKELLVAGAPKEIPLVALPGSEEASPDESDPSAVWAEAIAVGKKTDLSDTPLGKGKKVLSGDPLKEVLLLQKKAPEEVRQFLAQDLTRIKGPHAALAQAIYLKAASARNQWLLSREAVGPHRTDAAVRIRQDALAVLRAFAGRLYGQTKSELLRRNIVIDLDPKRSRGRKRSKLWPDLYGERDDKGGPKVAAGEVQRQEGSCGPTSLHIALCNRDPVRAWIVHDAGLGSFSATDAVGRFQANILLEYDRTPISRLASLHWKDVKSKLRLLRRMRRIRERDAESLKKHLRTAEPGTPFDPLAMRALHALRSLADGFPSDEILQKIQNDPLEGEDGLFEEDLEKALNQYLSPVTGHRYHMALPPKRDDQDNDESHFNVFTEQELRPLLRKAARFLKQDVAIVFGTSFPAHYMVMTGFELEGRKRKYMVTDPIKGKTDYFSEEQLISGQFLGKIFGMRRKERGHIDAVYMPEKMSRRSNGNGKKVKQAT